MNKIASTIKKLDRLSYDLENNGFSKIARILASETDALNNIVQTAAGRPPKNPASKKEMEMNEAFNDADLLRNIQEGEAVPEDADKEDMKEFKQRVKDYYSRHKEEALSSGNQDKAFLKNQLREIQNRRFLRDFKNDDLANLGKGLANGVVANVASKLDAIADGLSDSGMTKVARILKREAGRLRMADGEMTDKTFFQKADELVEMCKQEALKYDKYFQEGAAQSQQHFLEQNINRTKKSANAVLSRLKCIKKLINGLKKVDEYHRIKYFFELMKKNGTPELCGNIRAVCNDFSKNLNLLMRSLVEKNIFLSSPNSGDFESKYMKIFVDMHRQVQDVSRMIKSFVKIVDKTYYIKKGTDYIISNYPKFISETDSLANILEQQFIGTMD